MSLFCIVQGIEANDLRVEPMGHDSEGVNYIYFYGTRLYKEDPEKEEVEEVVEEPEPTTKKKK